MHRHLEQCRTVGEADGRQLGFKFPQKPGEINPCITELFQGILGHTAGTQLPHRRCQRRGKTRTGGNRSKVPQLAALDHLKRHARG